ncbi:heavy-metal-associated domain-containing protein [Streptomyces sp. NPDC002324]
MSCGHCAASVTDEVTQALGVTGVDVDVRSGLVTVRESRSTTRPYGRRSSRRATRSRRSYGRRLRPEPDG